MKRNRAGDDEFNPTRNNNRSVFLSAGLGTGEHGQPRAGWWGRAAEDTQAGRLLAGCLGVSILSWPLARPSQSAMPPLGVAKFITSGLDQVEGSMAWRSGPWAWASLPGDKSRLRLLSPQTL